MGNTHKEKRKRNNIIIKMIVAGKPLDEISARFNLSEDTIKDIYKKQVGAFPDKNKKRNQKIYKKILAGQSFAQVAGEYNLHIESIRQVYRKLGGIMPPPFKKKHKQENLQNGLAIAEKYIKGNNVFPKRKELLQLLIKKNTSTCFAEIYLKLRKKYKNIPNFKTLKKEKRKEELLTDLKQLYYKSEMPISTKYHLNQYGLVSASTYKYYFGTLRNACELAGVPCGKRGGYAKEKSRLIRADLSRLIS